MVCGCGARDPGQGHRAKLPTSTSDFLLPSQVILGKATVLRFTAIQCLCLTALWALKLSPSTALIFPSVIGVLMFLRVKLIPKIFSSSELMLLDTPIGATIA